MLKGTHFFGERILSLNKRSIAILNLQTIRMLQTNIVLYITVPLFKERKDL